MLTDWLDIYRTVSMAILPSASGSLNLAAADPDNASSSSSNGMAANYEDSDAYKAESNTAAILAPLVVFHVLALVVVVCRSYARAIITHSFGKDDVVMAASAILAFGGMITFFGMAAVGLGKHSSTIGHDDLVELNAWDFAQTLIAHTTSLGLLKISIALSLLRLNSSIWFQRALWALIGFVICYTLLGWFSFLLRCFPLRAFIDPDVPGTCYDINIFVKLALTNTGFNIFTDVCFATLPIPVVWKLQMRLRTRVYLVGVFSLGYVAVAMGIVKAVYQMAFAASTDLTYTLSVEFWGFLQINVGIIAACAPALKAILGNVLHINSLTPQARSSDYASGMPRSQTQSRSQGQSRAHRSLKHRTGPPDMHRISDDDDDDAFELREQVVLDGKNDVEASAESSSSPGATATRGSAGSFKSGTGSEEMILGEEGIKKTPHVSIHSER